MNRSKKYSKLVYRQECEKMMCELYESGMKQNDIAEAFNVNRQFVNDRIVSHIERKLSHNRLEERSLLDLEIGKLQNKLETLIKLRKNGFDPYGSEQPMQITI